MDINLKPCPFCGGEAKVVIYDDFASVRCQDCYTETVPVTMHVEYCAKDKAIEFWNHRVPEGPVEELADPLGFLDTN